VLKGTLDGYFTAMQRSDVEPYAVLSKPLVLEGWYWFWRSDRAPMDFAGDRQSRLGVIIGSHQAKLLIAEGYTLHAQVGSLSQLIKLLISGRIDAVLADKRQFNEVATELMVIPGHYEYRFFRYVPLGVYWSNTFLRQHPDFLVQFNRHIYLCAPEGFALADDEQEKVARLGQPLINEWRRLPRLRHSVEEQNRQHQDISLTDILAWNSMWADEFHFGPPRFSLSVLNNPLSQELRVLKYGAEGLVTNIVVTDEHGLNVGVSEMTSTYWRDVDERYQQGFDYPSDYLHIGQVVYDQATHRFHVEVSAPLYALDGTRIIGAIIVGVDVEHALAKHR
jgi:hypothetical protein